MKKRISIVAVLFMMTGALLAGCGSKDNTAASDVSTEASIDAVQDSSESLGSGADTEVETGRTADAEGVIDLEDGVYSADFETDSSMFHVNEACDGKGTLTVKDGKASIHISLTSKNIVNLFCGLAEDAQKDGAELLEPVVDTVTYSDGMTEEVYGFDVPVPALDEEFDLALIGTKGVWYDHKVKVTNPEPMEVETTELFDGTYTVELDFEGGSGKASIFSPATISVADGKITATFEWSSPNYDYMIVDGEKYLPVNEDGNSVFELPVASLDEPMTVIGDTVAMSKPHEIEYTITFHPDTVTEAE
ncbi:MAG: iron transporter [Agathobacter sp.]|nr:iron transporter [Agathobacter sp.]